MPRLQDAKEHLIKLIMSIDDYDEHEKIHALVHSLEAVCYCISAEQSLAAFQLPGKPPLDEYGFPLDDQD